MFSACLAGFTGVDDFGEFETNQPIIPALRTVLLSLLLAEGSAPYTEVTEQSPSALVFLGIGEIAFEAAANLSILRFLEHKLTLLVDNLLRATALD